MDFRIKLRSDMEESMITLGKVMFVIGVLGMILCGVTLCLLPRLFEKQRKELLKELEK